MNSYSSRRSTLKAKQHDVFLKATPLTKRNGVRLHILVVKGDSVKAESTATLLRSFGHQVQVVPDGQSALRAAQGRPPDVVLLELALPDLDAWEVAERLQELSLEKKPFFIGLADYDSEEDRLRSWQAGIDLHLVKPVAPYYLRRLLERFCRIIMPTVASSANGENGEPRACKIAGCADTKVNSPEGGRTWISEHSTTRNAPGSSRPFEATSIRAEPS
jgi:DNA-binding response OmpR family regulator